MESIKKNKAIIIISLLSIITGALVVSGWVLHIDALQSIIPGALRMKINPAICFIALGAALITTQLKPGKYNAAVYLFLVSLVGLISFITFLQYQFNFSCGIDQLLFVDKADLTEHYPYPGRMALNTSICFFLLSMALLGLHSKKVKFYAFCQYLLHLVTIVSAIALIGYLYGVSLLYSLLYVSSMALHTAVNLFLLSFGASLLHPNLGITSLFTGKRIGNLLAKRLFVLMAVMVVVFGALRLRAQHIHLFSLEIGVSLLVVCFLLACLFIVWGTAQWLNRIDEQRTKAEAEVKRMNAQLEKRVEERSSALIHSLDKLQKSEEKYRSLIEQASDAIYILDAGGNFTEVNDSMCNMVGYDRDELLTMNVASLIDPEQLKIDPLNYSRLAPQKSRIRERKFIKKGGGFIEVELNIKKLHDRRMLAIARDISQRKEMEAELKKAELKFRTVADKSMVGIYIIQQKRFLYINPRFAEIFGYEPGELLGDSPSKKIISDEYIGLVKENIRARMAGEMESLHYEVKGKRKDGSNNWVEFYGSHVMLENEPTIIGSMIDITERKMAEELILKEKELSDTIINSLPGVFYLKTDKGQYLRWNRNLEKVTGCTYEQIKNSRNLQFIAEEDREKVAANIDKIFSEGYSSVEVNGLTTDGVKIPYLLTGSAINYQGHRSYLGIGIDITQRVKATEELILSEQKYKLLFEDNPLPMWMIAKNDLSIIAANKAAAMLYGYSNEELLKMNISDLRLPEDMQQIQKNYLINLDDSRDMGVTKHVKKDGSMIDVQIIAHDIIFEGREIRLAHTNDVTEKLKTQEAHQKSEANLQTILNSTDTAYALLDRDLRVLEYNNKALYFASHEFNFDLQKGAPVAANSSQKRLSKFLSNARAVLNGDAVSYEVNYTQTNGTNLWYYLKMFPVSNKEKEIIGLMVAATDITERKDAEQSLRLAYEHIQTHIDSIKEITWKQSHLIRSPLANLKGLMPLMETEPDNKEVLGYIQAELDRMDSVIIDMAREVN